jgi:hypothetical protein
MYPAMPADEMVSENQLGWPYTWNVAVWVLPPLRAALIVAVEPAALAVLNQLLGMVVWYRRVYFAPLGPRDCLLVMLRSDAPRRLAPMVRLALDTSEWPNSS